MAVSDGHSAITGPKDITSNIGANEAGKRARTLFNCISVMDGIKINEQNKSIAIKGTSLPRNRI